MNNLGLLVSYSADEQTSRISFCERTTTNNNHHESYLFHYNNESVVCAPIPWLAGISPGDMFAGPFVENLRKSKDDKIHYEITNTNKRSFLAIIASILTTTDWEITATTGAGTEAVGNHVNPGKRFFFEKKFEDLPPPPPPQVIE